MTWLKMGKVFTFSCDILPIFNNKLYGCMDIDTKTVHVLESKPV